MGVGLLIKLSLLHLFDVAVISDKFEGILWVQFIHKASKSSFSVCACYLPPIGSSRGDQSLEFLDSLKSLVINNYHCGDFLTCGDFNAKCGGRDNLDNSLEPKDSIPKRVIIDTTINIGKDLISTLRSLELCILNGRLSPDEDSFTSVSSNGASVVDYSIAHTKSFHKLSNFKVIDPLLVGSNNNINIDSSLPDHRIHCVDLKLDAHLDHGKEKRTKTEIKTMLDNYMLNEEPIRKLEELAHSLTEVGSTHDVDRIYSDFCTLIEGQLESKKVYTSQEKQ